MWVKDFNKILKNLAATKVSLNITKSRSEFVMKNNNCDLN
jgi:hypothetical protein